MNAKQLHDYIIKPTLEYMGGNYNTPEARLLLLATAAIESDCGYYIKQVNGPALGIWQPEPATHDDIWSNCDALKSKGNGQGNVLAHRVRQLTLSPDNNCHTDLIVSPMYWCAMARLKYSMDSKPLPKVTGNRKLDEISFFDYYKRVYNTHLGASTFEKWQVKCEKHNIFEVDLNGK